MSKSEEPYVLGAPVRLDFIFDGLGYSESDRQKFVAELAHDVNKGFPVPVRPCQHSLSGSPTPAKNSRE